MRAGVRSWTIVVAGSLIIGGMLTGCGGGSSSDSTASTAQSTDPAAGTASVAGTSSGGAPTIQGTAPTTATVGQTYAFQPTASGGSGALSFAIANKPSWATFNASTGQLTGTPTSSDVGTDSNVEISVTDGATVASLTAFNITVSATGTTVAQGGPGTVTLTWQPPTQDTNGAALSNLSGYTIYYGTASQDYSSSIKVQNGGLSTYVVQNLTPGTYYFAVAAVDSTGAQSGLSTEVAAAVN